MVCWRVCFKIVLMHCSYKFNCVEGVKYKEQPSVKLDERLFEAEILMCDFFFS